MPPFTRDQVGDSNVLSIQRKTTSSRQSSVQLSGNRAIALADSHVPLVKASYRRRMVISPSLVRIYTAHDVWRIAPAASERPTLEWQDRLSESLARWAQSRQISPPEPSVSSSPRPSPVHRAVPAASHDAEEPARFKRRITAHAPDNHVSWNDMHNTAGTALVKDMRSTLIHMLVLDTDEDELDDWADAFGHLSLDEHREVRHVSYVIVFCVELNGTTSGPVPW